MNIFRSFYRDRAAWVLGLASLFGLAAGCGGGDPNATVVGEPTNQEQQDAERAAREKAFGKGKAGNPGKKQATQ